MRLTLSLLIALAFSLVLLAGCSATPPANAEAGPASGALTSAQASVPAQSPTESAQASLPETAPAGAPETAPAIPPEANANSITLTTEEVAKHSIVDDCWLIINGNVYDVSGFAQQHPGGPGIAQLCGKDGTETFNTRGDKGPHPETASEKLGTMLIGPLGGTVTG